MIRAIIRLQSCTTRPGRRAFVQKGRSCHGIAKGNVRYYQVTAPSWPKLRMAVGDCDTTGHRTMGFSAVNATTVEWFCKEAQANTYSTVRPMPAGWTPKEAPNA